MTADRVAPAGQVAEVAVAVQLAGDAAGNTGTPAPHTANFRTVLARQIVENCPGLASTCLLWHSRNVPKLRAADALALALTIVVSVAAVLILLPRGVGGLWAKNTIDDVPVSDVRTALANIEVRQRSDAPTYRRDEFGPAWADEDRNGCDTRNDILGRDLKNVEFRDTYPARCVVVSGWLDDPYTGVGRPFARGEFSSPLVQIDHVVALADAWQAGAWRWDVAQRQAFANDPANLLAVDGQANQDKGHATADKWLPENKDYRCAYVARQVRVKARWGLSVTQEEWQAIVDVLVGCPAMG